MSTSLYRLVLLRRGKRLKNSGSTYNKPLRFYPRCFLWRGDVNPLAQSIATAGGTLGVGRVGIDSITGSVVIVVLDSMARIINIA